MGFVHLGQPAQQPWYTDRQPAIHRLWPGQRLALVNELAIMRGHGRGFTCIKTGQMLLSLVVHQHETTTTDPR